MLPGIPLGIPLLEPPDEGVVQPPSNSAIPSTTDMNTLIFIELSTYPCP